MLARGLWRPCISLSAATPCYIDTCSQGVANEPWSCSVPEKCQRDIPAATCAAWARGVGIELGTWDASAALCTPTDLPVCSIGDMQPHRYGIAQCKGQSLLPSPLT